MVCSSFLHIWRFILDFSSCCLQHLVSGDGWNNQWSLQSRIWLVWWLDIFDCYTTWPHAKMNLKNIRDDYCTRAITRAVDEQADWLSKNIYWQNDQPLNQLALYSEFVQLFYVAVFALSSVGRYISLRHGYPNWQVKSSWNDGSEKMASTLHLILYRQPIESQYLDRT